MLDTARTGAKEEIFVDIGGLEGGHGWLSQIVHGAGCCRASDPNGAGTGRIDCIVSDTPLPYPLRSGEADCHL